MRASFLANLSKTKKTDIVVDLDIYIENEINPKMYWPLNETAGTIFSDSGYGLNDLQSVAEASDFNIAPSTPYIAGANQAKQIDTLTNHSLNVIGNDTDAGTLYNSFDALLFQIKRSVDPQVDTTILSYTNNGQVMQYKIVSGSSVVMTIKNGAGDTEDLTIIPDTNFMLGEWAFYAIVYDGFRGFLIYVNGILRSSFDKSLFGGVGGNFRVGGDLSPVSISSDLALDNILVVGDRLSELEVREIYSVWKFGYSSQDEVWVGESSEQNAISLPESSHIIGGLSTRTVIGKDQKFIAYKIIGDSDSSVEITIVEGTAGYSNRLNLYIYSGVINGSYTLQETHLKINIPDSNQFTVDNYIFNYTLPAVGSEAFLVFECTGSPSPIAIQFQTAGEKGWSNGFIQTEIVGELGQTDPEFGRNVKMAKGTKDRMVVSAMLWDSATNNNVGKIYIYRLDSSVWVLEQSIESQFNIDNVNFGKTLAISDDGSRIIVSYNERFGFPETDNVTKYYLRTGTVWTLHQNITTTFPTRNQSTSTSLSEDANTIAILNDFGDAQVEILNYNSETGFYDISATPPDVAVGLSANSLKLSGNGLVLAVSFGSGGNDEIYVYSRLGEVWTLDHQVPFGAGSTGNANYDSSLDLSDDGSRIIQAEGNECTIWELVLGVYVSIYITEVGVGFPDPNICGISKDGSLSYCAVSNGTAIEISEFNSGTGLYEEIQTIVPTPSLFGGFINGDVSRDGLMIVVGQRNFEVGGVDTGRVLIYEPL